MRKVAAAVALAVCACPTAAKVKLGKIGNVDLGTWTPGSGDIVRSLDLCVESEGNNKTAVPYGLRLEADAMQLEGRQGGPAVQVELLWTDLVTGTSEPLEANRQTPLDKTGAEKKCRTGDNARLRIRVLATDLQAAHAGRLEARWRLHAIGGKNGREDDKENIRIRVDMPPAILLSGVDNINLGLFDTVNDMTGLDSVCVYRNDGDTSYRLTATGDGPGGAFELSRGTDRVPMRLRWQDAGGRRPLQPGTPVDLLGADNQSTACAGVDNAALDVRVQAVDLQGQPPGSYAGTITLLVAPI